MRIAWLGQNLGHRECGEVLSERGGHVQLFRFRAHVFGSVEALLKENATRAAIIAVRRIYPCRTGVVPICSEVQISLSDNFLKSKMVDSIRCAFIEDLVNMPCHIVAVDED